MKNDICIKCGETKLSIRNNQLICGSVSHETGELYEEFGRHRFIPYSKKELVAFADEAKKDEEIWRKILAEDTDENWEKYKKATDPKRTDRQIDNDLEKISLLI